MTESPHTGFEGDEVWCWDGQYHRWHTNHRIEGFNSTGVVQFITWYCSVCRRVERRMSPRAIPVDETSKQV